MSDLRKALSLGFAVLSVAALGPGARGEELMRQPPSDRDLTLRDATGEVSVSPRAPFVDRLEPGESRRYRMPLNDGQYIHLAVEQRDLDVALRLFDELGEELIEVDTPVGATGEEVLHAVGGSQDTFILEIAAVGRAAGSYELEVLALRAATETDRMRVAAQNAFFAAKALAKGGADALPQAQQKYREALEQAERVPDPRLAASSLYNLAQIHQRGGDYRTALDCFQRARATFESSGDRLWVAHALSRIGSVHFRLRQTAEALDAYSRALDISRQLGDRRSEASALNNIGNVHRSVGELEQALHIYREALELWNAEDDTRYQATVLSNIGEVLIYLDQVAEALDVLDDALALSRGSGSQDLEALVLNSQARAHYRRQKPQPALECLEGALEIVRQRGSVRGISLSQLRLGNVYLRLERPEDARRSFEEALELFESLGDRLGQAMANANLGRIESGAGRYGAALSLFDRALEELRAIGDRSSEASTLFASAKALRGDGRLEEARQRARAAVEAVELLRSDSKSLELRSSYFASRQEYYDLYVDVLMDLAECEPEAGHDLRALEVSERRRARGLLDSLAEAATEVQLGADPALLAEKERLQRELNRVDNERIQLERSSTEEQGIEAARRRQRALLARYAELQGRIRRSSPRYAALIHPEPLTAEAIHRQLPDEETVVLVYGFGGERCFLWSITSEGIRSFVLPDRQQIEELGRKLHFSWSRNASWAERKAEVYARQLSELLLGEVAQDLGHRRLVVVGAGIFSFIPFAALPDPRSDPDEAPVPMIEHHEVLRLPSASVLVALRQQRAERTPPPGLVAVLADPVFSRSDPRVEGASAKVAQGDPDPSEAATRSPLERSASDLGVVEFERLPHSRVEATNIIALVPPEKGFQALGFEASRETVLSGRLRDYRLVHLASHGLLNAEHAELSGIVLSQVSPQGEPVNGFLRVHEIYDLDLAADLVTLSACKTGLGEQIRGEGLVGLAQAFLYAGASRVAVSLWNVSDAATAELMSRLYRGILERGLAPAAALREAQLSMLRETRWQSPKDWAGFVIYGDWR